MTFPPWFEKAEEELAHHVCEEPGPRNNPRILEYHAATSLHADADEIPWCSAFTNWCMRESGIRGTNSAAARSWLSWGSALNEPMIGCVTVIRRGANPALGHVGFYVGEEHGKVCILGGNQHDCVCLAWFAKADVIGYRWPKVSDFRESESKEAESLAALGAGGDR